MTKITPSRELNFNEACESTALLPDELVTLREESLILYIPQKGRRFYLEDILDIPKC